MASCLELWRWQNQWGASSDVWDCLVRKAADRHTNPNRPSTYATGTYQLVSRAFAVLTFAEQMPELADLSDDLAFLVAEFAFCEPIGPFGKSGGKPFTDKRFEAHTLKSISLGHRGNYPGRYVDYIGCRFDRKFPGEATLSSSHGDWNRYDSQAAHFELDTSKGEHITAANVRCGLLVDGLQFVTNTGRLSPWYGGHGGRFHNLQFPAPLRYISGRCGDSLDQITFHF